MGTDTLSFGTVAVLHAVACGYQFGFDVVDATGLTTGTVYPALDKLEDLGFLRSTWEASSVAQRENRPARRYFTLTAPGAHALAAALDKHRTFRAVSLAAFGIESPRPQRTRG